MTTTRRGGGAAGSPRRARRRTLFAPGPRSGAADPLPLPRADPVPRAAEAEAKAEAEAEDIELVADLALEEFVVDADDYPTVIASARVVAASTARPDRVDDIDDWLEEFAVSDGLDALPG